MVDKQKKKKAKLLEIVGLYLVMKLGWSLRANAYAIWFCFSPLSYILTYMVYVILKDKKNHKTFC